MKGIVLATLLAAAFLLPAAAQACTGFLCDYHPYRYDSYGNRYVHYDDYYHYREYWEDFYYDDRSYDRGYRRSSRSGYFDYFSTFNAKKPMKMNSSYYYWY